MHKKTSFYCKENYFRFEIDRIQFPRRKYRTKVQNCFDRSNQLKFVVYPLRHTHKTFYSFFTFFFFYSLTIRMQTTASLCLSRSLSIEGRANIEYTLQYIYIVHLLKTKKNSTLFIFISTFSI